MFFAQHGDVDSLQKLLKNAKADSVKIRLREEIGEAAQILRISYWDSVITDCKKLAQKSSGSDEKAVNAFYVKLIGKSLNNIGYIYKNYDDLEKSLDYYERAMKIFEGLKDKKWIALVSNNIGFMYGNHNQVLKALECYHRSFALQTEINERSGSATTLNNIGLIYYNRGDIPKALEYWHKSLKIQEEIQNKRGTATSLNNIGFVYNTQGDTQKALEYFERSLKIREEEMDKQGIATSLNNIGLIYDARKDYAKALEYWTKTLKIFEQINDKRGIANSLNNLGGLSKKRGDDSKAFEYFNKSLKIALEVDDKGGISQSNWKLATMLLEKGDVGGAFNHGSLCLKAAKEIGSPSHIRKGAAVLKKIYQKQNKYKEAFAMYELEMQMEDSLSNQETRKASVKKQFQYLYEKKAAADSVKASEDKKVANAKLSESASKLKEETTKRYALYGGLFLVLVFAGIMVNRFRLTNKQKKIIELKEIETQKQNEIISHQKAIVEESHKEITDSINYAERIQRALLGSKKLLDENLLSNGHTSEATANSYFVLFKPKAIVSGDFYWAASVSAKAETSTDKGHPDLFLMVTADSTGHGVPGAIMSILNIACLDKAVITGVSSPDQILNATRSLIIENLKNDGSPEGGKDGMDGSLLSFDFKNNILYCASANNPIWIIRQKKDLTNELIEISADRMPIGKHDKDKTPFTLHTFNLQKGDQVYTLTDGFADQFGGSHGKKFKYKPLQELLLSNAFESMEVQKQKLDNVFNVWKGKLEQIDDVCMIGIRV